MNLSIVTSYFPQREQPYRGRTAYAVGLELRRWMEVQAICPLARYPSWFQPRNFPYQRADLSFSPEGIPTRYLEYAAMPGLSRISNGWSCARVIRGPVVEAQPDILLSYWVYPDGYATAQVGRELGIPMALVAIGSDLNRIPDAITRHYIGKALQNATYVITMGSPLREQAIKLGADSQRTLAVTNGCDTSIFQRRDRNSCRTKLGIAPDEELILYVGRLDLNKGLRELLQSVASLRVTRTNLRLVYVGEGPAKDPLSKMARELGVAAAVTFLGPSDSQGVARWLGACDVFALPSYAEGSPNVITEALNCGRAVVASNVGGIPELMDQDAGILVPPRDAGALTRALDEALSREWDEEAITTRFRRGWVDLATEVYGVLNGLVRTHAGAIR